MTQVETRDTVSPKEALSRLKDGNEAVQLGYETAAVYVTHHAGKSNERDGEVYVADAPMTGVPGRHRADLTRQEAEDTIKGARTARIVPEEDSPWGGE